MAYSLFFIFQASEGQRRKAVVPKDTLYLKKGSALVIDRKNIPIENDTVIIVPRNKKYKIITKDERFYQNLKNKVKNNFWLNELHNIIIINPSAKEKKDTTKTIPSIHEFIPYHRKPIRNISIKLLQVFGPTINDTSLVATSSLEKLGNKLHIPTKQFVIKKNLLFKSGDLINPSVLADNERLLRSLPFIEDAKIEIQRCKKCKDSVDVVVIVKDVWSRAFNLKLENVSTGRLDLWDRNVLGFGHEIQNSILWDSKKRPGLGYEGVYRINNIENTFINGNLTYYNRFKTKLIGVNLDRKFYTAGTKYAGGLSIENAKTEFSYRTSDSLYYTPVKYTHFDVWVGRSFLLNRRNTIFNSTKNITFSLKLETNHFIERPFITSNSYYSLHNKKTLLFSTTYTQQAFFKSNYIYNFGRTEDIPVGGAINFTLGKEFSEFTDRNYADFTLSSGKYFGKAGYFQTSFTLGSFFNEKEHEQGIIKLNINYFSNLFIFGRFFFRQFVNFDFTQGIHRFDYEYLTINESNGIRGFKNDSVIGNRRIKMSWETVCFTPWKLYDFKMVMFLFADHTWIKPNNQKLFDWHPYTGIGFGFRFRNEHLVFNIIQIKFTFYPNIPSGSETRFLRVSGESTLSPPNFSPQAPDVATFN
ncbi:MAG TPA: hypothetical protein VHO72_03160 [Bacteroidales bacterium]|nr:hypothetical protein [Bacteroidales bacterium]